MNHSVSPRWFPVPAEMRLGPLWLAAALVFAASMFVAPRTSTGRESRGDETDTAVDLEAIQQAFQQVVERVAPSVVGIRACRHHVATAPPDDDSTVREQRVLVNGSGTIIGEEGLILTNEHVVQSATEIVVLFYDGSESPATLVAADPRSDLAILHVARSGLVPATMCDWTKVARGQWTIVLGNPFGLGSDGQLSAAVGVVANLGRQLPGLGEADDRFYSDMIQTTAPINPGHSGGPIFNVRGELIGVVTAMHTRAPADEGVGFAIPMTPAKRRVIESLRQGRLIQYGYLGLTVRVPELEEREILGLAVSQGVVVQQVEPDGPAANAGVQAGDVIRDYEGHAVTGPGQLAELVGFTAVGTRARLDLVRDGRTTAVEATVGLREAERVAWMRGMQTNPR